jgi:hypothetical protein
MKKSSGGRYLPLTLKADTYAIAYIDCTLDLKGGNVDRQSEEVIDKLRPGRPNDPRNRIAAC